MADEELITLNPEDYYDEQVFNHNFSYLENELKNKARLVNGKVPLSQLTIDTELSLDSVAPVGNKFIKRVVDKKADLNENGKIPEEQLPSYVDDVVEYDSVSDFPEEGEKGKIYVDTEKNETYRWSGTMYVKIGTKEEYKAVSVTSDANVVEIPDEAVDYAAISMIGGKTVKTKNLIPFPYYSESGSVISNVTYTYDEDGIITMNGTASGSQSFFIIPSNSPLALTPNKTYTLTITTTPKIWLEFRTCLNSTNVDTIHNGRVTESKKVITFTMPPRFEGATERYNGIKLYIRRADDGDVYNNNKVTIQIEEGSEATAYEPYFSGLHNAPVESVVSTMTNGNKSTLSFSELIKNLPDYGCGAGDIYNYVDIEEMKYHHRVGTVDMGTLGWVYSSASSRFYTTMSYVKTSADDQTVANIICSNYTTMTNSDAVLSDMNICFINSQKRIVIKDLAKGTDVTEFKTAMSGKILNYELATEEIIDIKPLVTILPIESGGTIELVNEHDLSVPNTVLYKEVL